MAKTELKKCLNCRLEVVARTYQLFCSPKCQNKEKYRRLVSGESQEQKPLICDICSKEFIPLRQNVKRCSELCRAIYKRNYMDERNKARTRKRLNASEIRTCLVCGARYQDSSRQKTCSHVCATKYMTYSEKKRRGVPSIIYRGALWPLPEQEPIKVSGFCWPPNREETAKATQEFLEAGGEIRKFEDTVEVDLLKDNARYEQETLKHEAEDQLFGIVRPS